MAEIKLNGETYQDGSTLARKVTVKNIKPSANWNALYIRPTSDNRFELVVQHIAAANDDFTFDEQVVATADMPIDLMLRAHGLAVRELSTPASV